MTKLKGRPWIVVLGVCLGISSCQLQKAQPSVSSYERRPVNAIPMRAAWAEMPRRAVNRPGVALSSEPFQQVAIAPLTVADSPLFGEPASVGDAAAIAPDEGTATLDAAIAAASPTDPCPVWKEGLPPSAPLATVRFPPYSARPANGLTLPQIGSRTGTQHVELAVVAQAYDRSGDQRSLASLARERGEAIRQKLQQLGVPAESIACVALIGSVPPAGGSRSAMVIERTRPMIAARGGSGTFGSQDRRARW